MAFYSAFYPTQFFNTQYQIAGNGNTARNGNRPVRQEYQPTYHELRERREIERKQAEIDALEARPVQKKAHP